MLLTKNCLECEKIFTNKRKSAERFLGEKQFSRMKFCSKNCIMKFRNKNEYIIYKDYAKILTRKREEIIIDKKYVGLCKKYFWSLNHGYPSTYTGGRKYKKVLKMYHFLLGHPPEGQVTDHINRKRLDNRRKNLRFVSPSINMQNKSANKENRYGIIGIGFDFTRHKYTAYIKSGKKKERKRFDNLEDAIRYRKKLEKIYFSPIPEMLKLV